METMLAPRGTRTAKDSQGSGAHGLRQTRSEPSGESTALVVATSTPRVWSGAGAGPGESQSRGTPLTCTLWCAIAIGALVQGQPPHTVSLRWKRGRGPVVYSNSGTFGCRRRHDCSGKMWCVVRRGFIVFVLARISHINRWVSLSGLTIREVTAGAKRYGGIYIQHHHCR